MRGHSRATDAATQALEAVSPYVDQLAHDEKLRRRLVAGLSSSAAARRRARRRLGTFGAFMSLASDPVLRAQMADAVSQLREAGNRIQPARRRRRSRTLWLVAGAGLALVAVPSLRSRIRGLRVRRPQPLTYATIEREIEVDVPVSTAYGQWTRFEEFPRFMEGVDEVTQLDDTLLHWAVTVAGRKAEWDARIVAKHPDQHISWESVDGRRNHGSVTFEPAGSSSRTRIRVRMSYGLDGPAEVVGSTIGLDERRVTGDLERFRELVEARAAAS